MACMTHLCRCGNEWFDNQARPACPSCGSTDVSHWFDEVEDHEPGDFFPGDYTEDDDA